MYKVYKTKYKKISKLDLERFNKNIRSIKRKETESKFLDKYITMVERALYLNNRGKLTKNEMKMAFRWNKDTAMSIVSDFEKGINIYLNIELEIYYKLQTIIKEINKGRPMQMNIFLYLLICWFIYTFNGRTHEMTEGDPFYVSYKIKRQKKLEKQMIIQKFNNEFRKYYHTIF